MSSLHKKARKTVRYTEEQAATVERAARLLSRRRGELIEDGEFIREASLRYAHEVLEAA